MLMKDAMTIINAPKPLGFMVSFEWAEGGMLRSDHFPEKYAGEKLIKTEEEAWEIARQFAEKTRGRAVNIYVVDDDFCPVGGYKQKTIVNR